MQGAHVTLALPAAFHSYFEIFDGPGELDAQSLKSILVLTGFSLTPAQVEAALISADVDGEVWALCLVSCSEVLV